MHMRDCSLNWRREKYVTEKDNNTEKYAIYIHIRIILS